MNVSKHIDDRIASKNLTPIKQEFDKVTPVKQSRTPLPKGSDDTMATPNSKSTPKANYKTYDAQARMIRAIVAAHPEVKWNYKEIVSCYGSDMTEHALNHRFRRFRVEAEIIREGLKRSLDPKDLSVTDDLPQTQGKIDKNNIAKYFGMSTGDGIQFQFRSIKNDAKGLRRIADAGGDVLSQPITTDPKATPKKATSNKAVKRSGAGAKRTINPPPKRISSDEVKDDEDDEEDYSDLDLAPTPKRAKTSTAPSQKNGTPTRGAAAKARATIADQTVDLQQSGTESTPDAEPDTFESIFGSAETKPDRQILDAQLRMDDPFSGHPYRGAPRYNNHVHHDSIGMEDMGDDGEI